MRHAIDTAEVRGMSHVFDQIATGLCEGKRDFLLVGAPGTGKTMVARRVATMLPAMSPDTAAEVKLIQAVAGIIPRAVPVETYVPEIPFQAPHFTISGQGMTGMLRPRNLTDAETRVACGPDGDIACFDTGPARFYRPGQLTLAHGGVLFLDELPEFPRAILEVTAGVHRSGRIAVGYAEGGTRATCPARFILIAAMNPCPCGYLGTGVRDCKCALSQVERYRARIEAFADACDLVEIQTPVVGYAELTRRGVAARTSATYREQIGAAWAARQ